MADTKAQPNAVSVEFHVDRPGAYMWVTWNGQLGGVLKDRRFELAGDATYWIDIYSRIAKEVVANQLRWWVDQNRSAE